MTSEQEINAQNIIAAPQLTMPPILGQLTEEQKRKIEKQESLQIIPSSNFLHYLHDAKLSILCTSYHNGKLIVISAPKGNDGPPRLHVRNLQRCMSIAIDNETNKLFVSSIHAIHMFIRTNNIEARESDYNIERIYTPRLAWYTGKKQNTQYT